MNEHLMKLFPHATHHRIYEILRETYYDNSFPLIKESVTICSHSVLAWVLVLYTVEGENLHPYKLSAQIARTTPEKHANVHLFISTDEHPDTKRISYRIHYGELIIHPILTSRRELYAKLKSLTGKDLSQVSMALDNRHNM